VIVDAERWTTLADLLATFLQCNSLGTEELRRLATSIQSDLSDGLRRI
jgi:hypothetical protein